MRAAFGAGTLVGGPLATVAGRWLCGFLLGLALFFGVCSTPAQAAVAQQSVSSTPAIVSGSVEVRYITDTACTSARMIFGDGQGFATGSTSGTPPMWVQTHSYAGPGFYDVSVKCLDVGSSAEVHRVIEVAGASAACSWEWGGVREGSPAKCTDSGIVGVSGTVPVSGSVAVTNQPTSVTVLPDATQRLKVDAKCEVDTPCVSNGAAQAVRISNATSDPIPVQWFDGSTMTAVLCFGGIALGVVLAKLVRPRERWLTDHGSEG